VTYKKYNNQKVRYKQSAKRLAGYANRSPRVAFAMAGILDAIA
jgi:hypothetical protein